MKKHLGIIGLLAAAAMLQAVELVRDGQLLFNGIVTPDKPVPMAAIAAKELVYHLKLATGTELPVITEKAVKPGGRYFYLGACRANAGLKPKKAGWNEGTVKISSDRIQIAGNDGSRDGLGITSSGTAFAVYEFLERYLGVRWIWPGKDGEIVPECRNLNLPETTFVFKPVLRSSVWRSSGGKLKQAWASEQARKNFYQNQSLWLFRHRFCCDSRYMNGHAFREYYDRYHKEHPDFFSMLPDGTRRPNKYDWSGGRSPYVSLCVTNQELVRTIVRNWAAGGTSRVLNLNENDTAGECCCDACLAADHSSLSAEERRQAAKKLFDEKSARWPYALGSLSDRYCQFYLDAQKEADKIDPKHEIAGLIYANYSEPPSSRIKLNSRIQLRFCPPYMYPLTRKKVDEYKRIWGGWSKTGARLVFRPNFTWSGHYFPIQYHAAFYEMFTFAVQHNTVAGDMDSLTGQYMVHGLVNYVIASLNHHPEKPLAQLEDEFYSSFGAAKEPVKKYFDYVTDLTINKGIRSSALEKEGLAEGGIGLARRMIWVGDSLFTPEVMAQCFKLIDDAAAAPGLDPVSARRVLMLRHGMKHLELAMAAQVEYRKWQKGAPADGFKTAYAKLQKFRKSIEGTGLINIGLLQYYDNLSWRKILQARPARRKP